MPLPLRLLPVFIGLSCALCASANAADAPANMIGYAPESAAAQTRLEQKFDAALKSDNLRNWLQQMSSQPNQLGSPHDKTNAEFVLKQFTAWGWDAHIETFYVLFPTPKERVLELVAPTHFVAKIDEPTIAEDATSKIRDGVLPPYNAYSADGDVTAELVYANYGAPDDYKELERRGISVKGKIVIARYGQTWRGIKPKLAQQHGAIGALIYSDPHDDGYAQGDTYPQGPFRSEQGVQRGSVADIPIYSGDPLTPGVGATKNAKRLKREDAPDLLKIPVMPISYGDALPLLKALGGPVAPANWRGALPITYHIGPGPAQVHLKLAFNWNQVEAYDVVATLHGSLYPDEWVLRGNHRDAWVFGASDPLSGQVAMLEEARVLGELHKAGWKPKRSIVYLSWDGEEQGLLGSTEWAETHADELKRKAVLYINSDNNGRGFLNVGGSHALEHAVDQIAGGIIDPQTGVSVLERRRAELAVAGNAPGANENAKEMARAAMSTERDLPIAALGSGSDYSPFLQHLGVAALDIGYGGEDNGGDYHSIYDSFDHYIRFADPDFSYGIALAKTAGHTVLRFADADVLPLRFGNLAETLARYADELHKLAAQQLEQTATINQLVAMNAYKLAADPKLTYVAPGSEATPPNIDMSALDNAIKQLKSSAGAYDQALTTQADHGLQLDRKRTAQLNNELKNIELLLTHKEGLPGRDWYQHMLYAPGLYTGYGVKTLPGVREAIEQKQYDQVTRYVDLIAATLNAYSQRLDKARALLETSR